MSMHVNFTPHSWYMGAAIKRDHHAPHQADNPDFKANCTGYEWRAYLLNGMTGYIVDFEALTLAQLKRDIKSYTLAEKARIARLYEAVQ